MKDRQYDLGFLGGGQLARMSIQAAQRMGLRCVSLDPAENSPASQIADSIQGSLDDIESLAKLIDSVERVTLENEFIPAAAIEQAFQATGRIEAVLVPGLNSLAAIQDKLMQRRAFAQASVASPRAVAIEGDGEEALEQIGFPCVLKARFGGYDGKGTLYVRDRSQLDALRMTWENGGWLAEEFVPFRRELAVMVIAEPNGCLTFPTMETIQTHHVCDLVFPSDADASEIAIAAVSAIGGHGLFGVELFQTNDGQILVNEIAPRPHNSGHYTLDWGGPSQFEAHVRVVMGYSPAQPCSTSFAVMANLLGQDGAGDYLPAVARALKADNVFVHWYGKAEAKAGRKMGHINVTGGPSNTVAETIRSAIAARSRFYEAWTSTGG